MERPELIERWHGMMSEGDRAVRRRRLEELLDDEAVFESPVVHTPQRGKALTLAYLASAGDVFAQADFEYLNEWFSAEQSSEPTAGSAVLEFRAEIDGIEINGVDLIWWNEQQRIVRFKVMVRPRKAMQLLHSMMARQLEALAAATSQGAPT